VKTTLTYGSVCSGMEAATLAWSPLGWRCAFVSEIEKAPCALLKERFPDVPNFGDMTKFEDWPDVAIDLLAGGTPCQSFSVAGLRRGLTDPRGSLMLTYGAIAKRYRPTWLFWENVPGVLSSNGGRDFGAFLGMLAELGYGFAYRVLDAQFFGLAQRRKRVFVVGYLGDWRPPAAVLFESASLRGDPPPRREPGQRPAPTIAARTKGGGGLGTDFDCDGGLIPEIARALTAHPARIDGESETFVTHALRADGFDASEDGTGRGTPLVPVAFDTTQITSVTNRSQPRPGEPCHPVTAEGHAPAIAFQTSGNCGAWETGDITGALDTNTDPNSHVLCFSSKDHGADVGEIAPTLRAMGHAESHANAGGQLAVAAGYAVRRLTPRECERLQGAPDDHTLITYRGKPAADGPRYKMIGNSWAVPCVRWIGERISQVHDLKAEASSEDGIR